MVADTADGADGAVGSVLARGRYPDGPRSQPPLAAEDDLNPVGPRASNARGNSSGSDGQRLHEDLCSPGSGA